MKFPDENLLCLLLYPRTKFIGRQRTLFTEETNVFPNMLVHIFRLSFFRQLPVVCQFQLSFNKNTAKRNSQFNNCFPSPVSACPDQILWSIKGVLGSGQPITAVPNCLSKLSFWIANMYEKKIIY